MSNSAQEHNDEQLTTLLRKAFPEDTEINLRYWQGFLLGIAAVPHAGDLVGVLSDLYGENLAELRESELSQLLELSKQFYQLGREGFSKGEPLMPVTVVYSQSAKDRIDAESFACGLSDSIDYFYEQWMDLAEAFGETELGLPDNFDYLPEQLDAIGYIFSVVADSESAVSQSTSAEDLPGIFETFAESLQALGLIGAALRQAVLNDPERRFEFSPLDIISNAIIPGDLGFEQFKMLYQDKNIAKNFASPTFVLGAITGIASAPETIPMEAWFELLTRDDVPAQFKSKKMAKTFSEFVVSWWNYLVDAFENKLTIMLPDRMHFDFENGANEALKEFARGYLVASDWLKDVWDDYVEAHSQIDEASGIAMLMALQIASWPEQLSEGEQEIPRLLELAADEKELLSIFRLFISDLGTMGLRIAQAGNEMEIPEPAVNPYRNVGRNDPCPCGSGKKFKKCCLH